MDINYELIGNKIREYRESKGYSQEELADIIGISWRHFNYLEHGERKINVGLLIAISNALNITADDLLIDFLTGSNAEFLTLLNDTNITERAILMDMLRNMKKLLQEHGI